MHLSNSVHIYPMYTIRCTHVHCPVCVFCQISCFENKVLDGDTQKKKKKKKERNAQHSRGTERRRDEEQTMTKQTPHTKPPIHCNILAYVVLSDFCFNFNISFPFSWLSLSTWTIIICDWSLTFLTSFSGSRKYNCHICMCVLYIVRFRLPVFSMEKFWQEVEYTYMSKSTRNEKAWLVRDGSSSIFDFVTENLSIFWSFTVLSCLWYH